MGLRKQFMNNFVFPTWACAAGFNNNNNNNASRAAELINGCRPPMDVPAHSYRPVNTRGRGF